MKAGLEVHQQLATGKLFCECPAELSDTVLATISRRLRATEGENHLVDRAAQFQAARQLLYRYEATPTSCLVELDEEPPHALNPDAVEVALTVALALNARPVDEIEVMRKIVIDGSNTTGFQRTALVAVDGKVEVGGKTYSVPTICLEEDAARRMGDGAEGPRFRLDRLGVPLIELATGPEIGSGAEARDVAAELGALLRATGRVRRGIGTIREDLNVSTEGGSRVEIKGVQELRLIPRYAEGEERRQRHLLRVRDDLARRGASVPDDDAVDVSELFRGGGAPAVQRIVQRGGVALAVRLRGFAGSLKGDGAESDRLGRELADHARSAGVRGLLHSDEAPVTEGESQVFDAVRQQLQLGAEDAWVVVAAPDRSVAHLALRRVLDRARQALTGVPAETRDPLPDGRTRYSRPLPGSDRMYPETDVPPIPVGDARLERLRAHLPEAPRLTRARLVREYSLGEEPVAQLWRTGEVERFERLVAAGHGPALVSRLLTRELPELESTTEAASTVPEVPFERLDELLTAVEGNDFSKEGIAPVLRELRSGAVTVAEAASRAGLAHTEAPELRALAEEVVRANAALIAERGEAAFSPLMGDLMAKVRGRADGQQVAKALRDALSRHSSGRVAPHLPE